jgi:hypothetical protein
MSKHTTSTAGISKPHKGVAAVPGIGSAYRNARSINTEQGGHKPAVEKGGVAKSYYGNSRAINSARGQHGSDK